MNPLSKRIRIMAAVDAALVALIVAGLAFSPRRSDERASRRDLLADPGAVASVRLGGPEALELVKDGSGWKALSADGALPADGTRVEAFLSVVDAVDRMETVAKDRSSWGRLGLEGESARRVTLSSADGSALSDFTLGAYAQSPGTVYVAPYGAEEAFSVSSGMASYVLGKRASWLDLRAWNKPPSAADVQELELQGTLPAEGGGERRFSYTASRSGSQWVAGSAVLDTAKVEALLRAVSGLRGDDYAPLAEAAGPSVLVVELRLGNGRNLRLSVEAGMSDGRYPVASSQRDRRFYVSSWALTEALKTLEELLPGRP